MVSFMKILVCNELSMALGGKLKTGNNMGSEKRLLGGRPVRGWAAPDMMPRKWNGTSSKRLRPLRAAPPLASAASGWRQPPQADFTTSLEQLVDGKVALENKVTAILDWLMA
jgi:hypothetical protein